MGLSLTVAPERRDKGQVTPAWAAWLGLQTLLTPSRLPAPGSGSSHIPLPSSRTVPADGLLVSRCCPQEVLSGVAGQGLVLACQS